MSRRIWLPVLAATALVACGNNADSESGASGGDLAQVVVTHPVLGSVVRDLVGDTAEVVVLMPNGVDPHDFSPSAKDIEKVNAADALVVNGLGLEEGLLDAIEEAEANGVPVFEATDHIEVRQLTGGVSHEDGDHGDEAGHGDEGKDGGDPHFWVDPTEMRRVVAALGPFLGETLGLDLGEATAASEARLAALDKEVREQLGAIPADRRRLVTGHESLGYLADEYGLTLIGAVIPSSSTQAEASAAQLAKLKEAIEAAGVDVIFTELGTPSSVVKAIADETGADVVELPSHTMPDDGSYVTFVRDLAGRIAEAL